METLNDLAFGLLSGLAYGLAGIVLLGLGFIALDLVTPGKLGDIVFNDRNPDAALVVASGVLAIGTIVTTAIVTSDDAFLRGLSNVAGYGLLGVVLLGISFLVVDKLTPGDLGQMLMDAERHPAALITAASHLAVGAIIAAAIA
jgi:uncharacterized membrane protein YjfL (UPF0719 family)